MGRASTVRTVRTVRRYDAPPCGFQRRTVRLFCGLPSLAARPPPTADLGRQRPVGDADTVDVADRTPETGADTSPAASRGAGGCATRKRHPGVELTLRASI